MGFGILFCGFFLLLNVFWFQYTDLLSALILLYGLYKLSRFEKNFRMAEVWAIVFCILGAGELVLTAIALFSPGSVVAELFAAGTPLWIALPRYAILASMTVFLLNGIRLLGEEVDAPDVMGRAKRYLPINLGIYGLSAILEFPAIPALLGNAAGFVFVLSIGLQLGLILLDLSLIHRAYMRICLPSDLTAEEEPKKGEKPGASAKGRPKK